MDLGAVAWLGGSPCSGKSSVAGRLAERGDVRIYHVDEAFGDFVRRVTPDRHPVTSKWTTTPWNDLWMQPTDVLLAEAIAAYSEQFELILEDLRGMPDGEAVLAEGTALLPALVAPLLASRGQALWMVPTEAFQRAMYPKRGTWVQDILASCADPDAALKAWMDRDVAFARWVAAEACVLGLSVVWVDGSQDIAMLTELVVARLDLGGQMVRETEGDG
ncbi:MAG: hypothetical protein MUF84_02310 [Anaerolineae bacterium]|nr:hypothetical protein [Anaerolineae bacterium]